MNYSTKVVNQNIKGYPIKGDLFVDYSNNI